jgi:hypothetical protein
MKWLDRWFHRKWHEIWTTISNPSSLGYANELTKSHRRRGLIAASPLPSTRSELEARPITFKLYTASGGWVLEYNFYDEKEDNNINSLHVIHHDDDLGQAISRIMTFETLKR